MIINSYYCGQIICENATASEMKSSYLSGVQNFKQHYISILIDSCWTEAYFHPYIQKYQYIYLFLFILFRSNIHSGMANSNTFCYYFEIQLE